MDEEDVKSLALKLSAVTNRIAKRLDTVTRETLAASQAMGAQAQESLAASEQVSVRVQRATGAALDAGTREAIERLGGAVRASEVRIEGAAEQLEERLLTVGKLQAAFAWKAFAALALGSLSLMGVAGYLIFEARETTRTARWVRQINAAQTAGRLALCPTSGDHVCAKVGKRWVQLDP